MPGILIMPKVSFLLDVFTYIIMSHFREKKGAPVLAGREAAAQLTGAILHS